MTSLKGDSDKKEVPAVFGENTADGDGVRGTSKAGTGVIGTSESGVGVWGGSQSSSGVGGMSDSGIGVHGVSKAGPGVRGDADNGVGVFGGSKTSTAIGGMSDSGLGVHGISKTADGVFGTSENGRGVVGVAKSATGVEGNSTSGTGVYGSSQTGVGVHGHSVDSDGVKGESANHNGVSAFGGHTGIYAKGPVNAGYFEGNIHVQGDITTAGDVKLFNADCAEDFDIADPAAVEPGTVMVLANEGILLPSERAYDKRVAGVISGAGDHRPAIVLDKQPMRPNRLPVALLGKVFCKVDASHDPIEVGDLLTTSPSPGHAMKATDPQKAFGAIIGKALRPLEAGQGLIPILVALH